MARNLIDQARSSLGWPWRAEGLSNLQGNQESGTGEIVGCDCMLNELDGRRNLEGKGKDEIVRNRSHDFKYVVVGSLDFSSSPIHCLCLDHCRSNPSQVYTDDRVRLFEVPQ